MIKPMQLQQQLFSIVLLPEKSSMEKITYDDFAKVEISLGTILSVEVVPDADKLLKLEVDFGEEVPRQILSGIREYYEDPQVLVGKQCPFITNLAPRTIRGLESNGMILAGNTKDAFTLLHPSTPLANGTKLK
jgi:methionyl-tRNA synthetase